MSGRHQAFASQELLGLKVAWNYQMFCTLHAEEDSLKLPHRVTLSQLLGAAGFIENLSSKYGHGMHLKRQTPQVLCDNESLQTFEIGKRVEAWKAYERPPHSKFAHRQCSKRESKILRILKIRQSKADVALSGDESEQPPAVPPLAAKEMGFKRFRPWNVANNTCFDLNLDWISMMCSQLSRIWQVKLGFKLAPTHNSISCPASVINKADKSLGRRRCLTSVDICSNMNFVRNLRANGKDNS